MSTTRKTEHRLRLAMEKEVLGHAYTEAKEQLFRTRATIIAVLEALNPKCPACFAAAEKIQELIKEKQ